MSQKINQIKGKVKIVKNALEAFFTKTMAMGVQPCVH